jgi:hypothetical protein
MYCTGVNNNEISSAIFLLFVRIICSAFWLHHEQVWTQMFLQYLSTSIDRHRD